MPFKETHLIIHLGEILKIPDTLHSFFSLAKLMTQTCFITGQQKKYAYACVCSEFRTLHTEGRYVSHQVHKSKPTLHRALKPSSLEKKKGKDKITISKRICSSRTLHAHIDYSSPRHNQRMMKALYQISINQKVAAGMAADGGARSRGRRRAGAEAVAGSG